MKIDRDQVRLCIGTARHIGGDHTAALSAGDAQALLDALEEAEARLQVIQDLVDQADIAGEPTVNCTLVQQALDADLPSRH